MDNEQTYEPVTVIVSRVVKPGHDAEFEEWVKGVSHEALKFEGHMGVDIIKPAPHAQRREYALIFRFTNYDNLRKWELSDVRREWVQRVLPITIGDARWEVVTGLEYWFFTPGAQTPPPRYKMVVVTWLALTPLAFFVPPFLTRFIGDLPPLLITALITAVMVLLMTYIVMPFMTKIFARWLFSQ
jgi:hypothetical protein